MRICDICHETRPGVVYVSLALVDDRGGVVRAPSATDPVVDACPGCRELAMGEAIGAAFARPAAAAGKGAARDDS